MSLFYKGKKAFFVVADPVEEIVKQIEYNGGRNGIYILVVSSLFPFFTQIIYCNTSHVYGLVGLWRVSKLTTFCLSFRDTGRAWYNGNWSYLSPCIAEKNNTKMYTTNIQQLKIEVK